MCNKPAFFIIDAASQEVLLVSGLTLANTAQTENNGATLAPIKKKHHPIPERKLLPVTVEKLFQSTRNTTS